MSRGRPVESGVFVIPLPLGVDGLSQPRHKVHPLAVGDGLQSGDLHSLPGLARRRNLSRETAADTEVSVRLLTADSSMCGQPPQIFSGDAMRPQRSRRFQTTSRFRQHFICKCTWSEVLVKLLFWPKSFPDATAGRRHTRSSSITSWGIWKGQVATAPPRERRRTAGAVRHFLFDFDTQSNLWLSQRLYVEQEHASNFHRDHLNLVPRPEFTKVGQDRVKNKIRLIWTGHYTAHFQ